jgi:hypothetical protein
MNLILSKPQVIVDIAAEPVAVTKLKEWMKISFNDDDSLIYDLSRAARQVLESYTGLSFGVKTLSVQMDIDCDMVRLPYGPLQSVTSIVLHTGFGNNETLTAGSDYELFGKLLHLNRSGVMTITYTGGYIDMPEDLIADIKRLVAWMFQNRGIQFETGDEIKSYPQWNALAANRYIELVV